MTAVLSRDSTESQQRRIKPRIAYAKCLVCQVINLMKIFLLEYLLLVVQAQIYRKVLHSYPALVFDCANPDRDGHNTLIGGNYFYPALTNNGAFTSLDKITIMFWAKFIDESPKKEKQVFLQLVDGPGQEPYINLKMYIVQRSGILTFFVENRPNQLNPTSDIETSVPVGTRFKVMDLDKYWNHLIFSLDQTTGTPYVNMKFYDTKDGKTYINQQPYFGKMFNFRLSEQTRITNERLVGQDQEVRMCGYMANLEFILGWNTMDFADYVDYGSSLVFHLKPLQGKLENLAPVDIPLKDQKGIDYSGPVGLKVYLNTQAVFVYEEQFDSFTMAFWMYPKTAKKMLLVSLAYDHMLETTLGIGVQNNKLLMYKSFDISDFGTVEAEKWNHIIFEVFQVSRDIDFTPNNEQKYGVIFVDGKQVDSKQILNMKLFQRIVIGQVFRDRKDANYVDLQEVKIFRGAGLMVSPFNTCRLQVGMSLPYCLYCETAGSHSCQENQDPTNDSKYYLCPQGFKYNQGTKQCMSITIPNCIREIDSKCEVCGEGYNISSGSCVAGTPVDVRLQKCDSLAFACQVRTNNGNLETVDLICFPGNPMHSTTKKCQTSGTMPTGCSQAQSGGCYKCTGDYMLKNKQCVLDCTPCVDMCKKVNGKYAYCDEKCNVTNTISRSQLKTDLRFSYKNECLATCPKYYSYRLNCYRNLYVGTCLDECPATGKTLAGTCALEANLRPPPKGQGTSQFATITCQLKSNIYPLFGIRDNTMACRNPQCEYCFHSDDTSCLSCRPNLGYFLDRLTAKCVKSCTLGSLLPYTNRVLNICESACPPDLVISNYDCLEECPVGESLYFRRCSLTPPPGTYLNGNVFEECPEICSTCHLDGTDLICDTCLGSYPRRGTRCVPDCQDYWHDNEKSECVVQCPDGYLTYENPDLNGFAFKECFKDSCGSVIANDYFFTVKHQTDETRCMQPCEEGFYADYEFMRCKPCTHSCKTCVNRSNFCLSCLGEMFLFENACFLKCEKKFADFLQFKCVGSCPKGYTIEDYKMDSDVDQTSDKLACVTQCGNYEAYQQEYSTYVYSYRMYCYESKPSLYVHCDDQHVCQDCDITCSTCTGWTSNDCETCVDLYFYEKQCLPNCPQNMKIKDSTNWRCADKCPEETKVYNNECYKVCPVNKFEYIDVNELPEPKTRYCFDTQPARTFCLQRLEGFFYCQPCHAACQICTGARNSQCSKCAPNYYLYGSRCDPTCPDTYLMNSQDWTCAKPCPIYEEGKKCVSSCSPGALIFQRFCLFGGCPPGYYQSGSTCYPCHQACAVCADYTNYNCSACQPWYFLLGKSCGLTCPLTHQFHDETNWACTPDCPVGTYIEKRGWYVYCVKSCPSKFYSRVCFDQCPAQTYQKGKECLPCATICSVCTGSTVDQCQACDDGYFLDNSTCVSTCPPTKAYGNLANGKCVATCPVYTMEKQKLCFDSCPFYLYQYELSGKKECVQNCYASSYISGLQCQACDSRCLQCFGNQVSECMQCAPGYYLDQTTCISSCPYFQDEVNFKCSTYCPANLFIDGTKCIADCGASKMIYKQTCLDSCPSNTYITGNICYDCKAECTTCVSLTECRTCVANHFLEEGVCGTTCSPDKKYDMESLKCVDFCPSHLYDWNDKRQCVTACNPPMYIDNEGDLMCLKSCFQGYYGDSNYKCVACDISCKLCTAADVCQECNDGYYLNVNKCVISCGSTLYMDQDNKLCQSRCPNPKYHYQIVGATYTFGFCLTKCLNTSAKKTFQYNEFCLAACPPGMWADPDFACKSCPYECLSCTTDNNCTACIEGYYLSKGKCGLSCGSQLLRIVDQVCADACDTNEFIYDGKCVTACPTLPFRYETSINGVNMCVEFCPSKTYIEEQNCLSCHAACKECNGPTDQDCLGCAVNYFENDQECKLTCPIGLLKDLINMECTETCKDDQYLDGGECKQSCPILTYKRDCIAACPLKTYQKGTFCLDCDVVCSTCNDSECLSCELGNFLYNGACEPTCTPPSLYDNVNRKCVQKCSDTQYQYIDSCQASCPLGYFDHNRLCVKDCPISTAISGDKCIGCQERCLQCLSANQCTKCDKSFFNYDGVCLISCPIQKPFHDEVHWLCQADCPFGTNFLAQRCVAFCPNLIKQRVCVDDCLDGYYANEFKVCSPCKSECKTCSSFELCLSCNENYFLYNKKCQNFCPNIKDTTKWECSDTCSALLYDSVCYSKCPPGTNELKSTCTAACFAGYYPDAGKCTICPRECVTCTSKTMCQSCNLGYFYHENSCQDGCPKGLVGNIKLRNCAASCPKNTFEYNGICQYSCPKGYLYRGSLCTQECLKNQYRFGNHCLDCAIECDDCTGPLNSQCKKCALGFSEQDGKCVGPCITGYTKIESMCEKCKFECKTCIEVASKCTSCKGDRIGENCSCPIGYYDDQFNTICQKCPCLECTDESKCTKCKNNLQPPLCNCERTNNEDWCITCDVARTEIRFSYDLNFIYIDFGYLILVDMLNPFDPSDCSKWLTNSQVLGTGSQCYLDWSMTRVVIQLGKGATIEVGAKLQFVENLYKDVNDISCKGFIKQFIDNTVKEPHEFRRPYVEFNVQSLVSSCMEFNITQIPINGTGMRDLKILKYELAEFSDEEHYYEVEYLLQKQGSQLNFPMNSLKPNQTYEITAKYINMFGKVNQTTFSFKTVPSQKAYVYFNPTSLQVKSFIYDCHITYQNLGSQSFAAIFVNNLQNETLYKSSHSLLDPFEVSLQEVNLPKGQPLLMILTVEDLSYEQTFVIPSERVKVEFRQKSRFTNGYGKINARGHNMNLDDQIIRTYHFLYEWRCINLYELQPCRSSANQIIEFPNERVLQLNIEAMNTTYAFYARATLKDNWGVNVNLVIVNDVNLEEEYVPNLEAPVGTINPNDDVIIILKNPKQYAMIMHDYRLVGTVKIVGSSMKFKLAEIQRQFGGSNIVTFHLIPGTESIKLTLNENTVSGRVVVTPEEGTSLGLFKISIEIQSTDKMLYSYYYYFNYEQLMNDYDQVRYKYANPILIDSAKTEVETRLPTGIDQRKIYILVIAKDSIGALRYFNTTVQVIRKDYDYAGLIQSLSNKDDSKEPTTLDMGQISVVIDTLQIEQKQVCLKQCSGVGSCVDSKCVCPPGYYFDDCSGDAKQLAQFEKLQAEILSQIFNQSFQDPQSFKQVAKSLNYLMQFKVIWEKFDQERADYLLTEIFASLQSKIDQINQLGINMEYQQNAQFKHDQLDLNRIIEPEDIQLSISTLDLVWANVLKSNSSSEDSAYKLCYKLRKVLENSVELIFETMLLDSSMDLSGLGAYIMLNRTTDIEKVSTSKSKRMLTQIPIAETNKTFLMYYDVVQQIFVRNLYALDGYFPYPEQQYPLYDYKIRIMRRKANIPLLSNINYSFPIVKPLKYVCITRNHTDFQWTKQFCRTNITNTQVICSCNILAPTTMVDDYKYIFEPMGSQRLKLPNVIFYILLAQSGLWVLLLIMGIQRDQAPAQLHEEKKIEKYGHVKSLNLKPRMIDAEKYGIVQHQDTSGNADSEHSKHQKDLDELMQQPETHHQEEHKDQDEKVAKTKKFSLEYLQYHHFILNVIYKTKQLSPRWFRAMLVLMRMTVLISLGGLFAWLGLIYEIGVFPMLGSILFLRALEAQIKKMLQGFQYKENFGGKLMLLFTVVILIAGGVLGFLIFWWAVYDETDWIMSYAISFGIDILVMDIFLVLINRFLGEESKKALKKKVKQLKNLHNIKKVSSSTDFE